MGSGQRARRQTDVQDNGRKDRLAASFGTLKSLTAPSAELWPTNDSMHNLWQTAISGLVPPHNLVFSNLF